MFAGVVRRAEHSFRSSKHLRQVKPMPRAGVRRPVPPFFFTFEVEHGPAPRFGVQLEKAIDAQPRFPQEVVHVEL